MQLKSHPVKNKGGQVIWNGIATDVTDRHLLETEINRLAQALEQNPTAVLITDTQGTLLFMNEACTRISGYQFADLYDKNRTLRETISTEMSDAEYAEVRSRLQSGNSWSGLLRNRRKSGTLYWEQITVSPIYDSDGKVANYLFLRSDVTERKLDEETRQRLNRELRAISNCNQMLLRAEDEQTLLDEICRIVCDEGGYRMAWVGYAENDEAKTVRPVARAGVEDGYLAQAGITWADTERGRGPSGTAIRSGKSACIDDFSTDPQAAPWRESALQRGYRSTISMPLKDESANTFGILNIYSTEPNAFTPEEIRLLEELSGDLAFGIVVLRARIERQCAQENLRQMNERYALSNRAAHLGVWDWNLQKNELVWDDRMYELYGVKREDFAGAYEAWLQGIHPDDRAPSDEISKQAQRGEREYDTEFRVVWPDGSIHYLKAYGEFVRDADGRPVRMTGVNFDISDQRRAEEEIRKLNQELEHRVANRTAELLAVNKELEAFAYSVSHDLRAPLRHIDGFLDLLKTRTAATLDDKSQHYMDTISNAAKRMGQLIDDLLAFSRMGRNEMAEASVDLGAVLQEVVHEFDSETRGRTIDWRIGELPVVTGDRAMLHVVLVNLISNALKFTQKREKAEIEVGCLPGVETETETVVFVRDNGAGFDMQYVDKLFGVFQRLHGIDEFEGTGIGLANVRRIITRHGGKTWADGKLNEGATFYFSIPSRGAS
jgi:PAS domain S-box-containing protein